MSTGSTLNTGTEHFIGEARHRPPELDEVSSLWLPLSNILPVIRRESCCRCHRRCLSLRRPRELVRPLSAERVLASLLTTAYLSFERMSVVNREAGLYTNVFVSERRSRKVAGPCLTFRRRMRKGDGSRTSIHMTSIATRTLPLF